MNKGKTIYLIDGSSYLYRAFFAIPTRLTSPNGMPTTAIYGFAQMLQKVLNEKNPEFLCILFDAPGPKFRHSIYEDYKKTREAMPEDLALQVGAIKEMIDAYGIPRLEKEGYEADDLIASICRWAKDRGFRVVIVSGDKDLHQLIEKDQVLQWDPQRNIWYDEKKVEEKFGVPPSKMRDFLALVGDTSDNIPGVPGIGPKRAAELLTIADSVEDLLKRPELIPPKLKEKILENLDNLKLSQQLVTLKYDAIEQPTLEMLKPGNPDFQKLYELFKTWGFQSLLPELEKKLEISGKTRTSPAKEQMSVREIPDRRVTVIKTEAELRSVIERIHSFGHVSIDLETTSEDPMRAEIVGVALAVEPLKAWYLPITHRSSGVSLEEFLSIFGPVVESQKIEKWGQNLKYEYVVFKRHGLELRGISFDSMIASYLLEPGQHSHRLEWIVERYLGEKMTSFREVTSANRKGKSASFANVPLDAAAEYAGADAEVVIRLEPLLRERLTKEDLMDLFTSIELPLIEILGTMEHHGVLIDENRLHDLSKELEVKLQRCEEEIYRLAGQEFNIQSPKQLAEILFNRLGLPVIKKTKTGPSTDMSVLEELALHHPIAQEILAYRSLAKLKNTYVDSLPQMINPETGRIHTSYNQTVTATGRLSSSNPNLQNIPIRTDEGRRIREAFIAPEGCTLVAADYSQIELRVLAHYSGDPKLLEAFARGDDIHASTAAEVFQVKREEVTPEMRRQAKAINFGIIYGMGPFGLSKALGISKTEAKRIIEEYFERYSGVKRFIDETVQKATERGFVRTLMGRKRSIPELQSKSKTVRQQGERLAVNTTIQGTAADLIKKAMIDIYSALKSEGFQAVPILQVHDELVFEAPKGEENKLCSLIREKMAGVYNLKVPLVVDIGQGSNWAEAH
ncbi:DNA polymerase I [Thermodesulforhabdus norvegica]|uniref:DNA polymerase I n=1 Tax=Thermodesulforhabdus norvegica TaxID=39841 RepID=A0A1I4SDG9_9BACT|nr:DNA polymerase I [Thermodesulforhabdus norvegica]SFM62522.1 DNA polymerase I [Thermodesulforhabdus norvegica]